MKFKNIVACVLFLLLSPGSKKISASEGANSLQASNLLNPNISVIGWIQGETGHRQNIPAGEDPPPAIQLKEAEIGFQAVVDPYARADFFISVNDEGAAVEEGYINWFSLPGGLAVKAGKFRANVGKFNRTHAGETPFADRPLVHQNYFGEEGLSGTGASASWQIPIPWFYLNLDAEATTAPTGTDSPAFEAAKNSDLLYLGRLFGYVDLSEAANVTLGGSYALGPAGEEFDSANLSSTTLHSQIYGLDATFRWKNPRRAVYRSAFWQTEIFRCNREVPNASLQNTFGVFSHFEYQFAQRWKSGVRYDYSELPADKNWREQGGLAYVTFTPSEFSLISLQGRHLMMSDGTKEDLGFLKITFNIGPHGSHPF